MTKETYEGADFEALLTVLDRPGIVLVDVYATWCLPCRQQAAILDEVASDRPDIAIVELDFDLNEDLARALGVTGLPTLLVFDNGHAVATHRGLLSKAAVLALIDGVS